MSNYNDLRVYQDSYSLAVDIAKELKSVNGNFRLIEQVVSSSCSIGSNIAEMCALRTKGEKLQKLYVCIGEANETEHRLTHMMDVGLIGGERCKSLIERTQNVRKMLYNLKKSME